MFQISLLCCLWHKRTAEILDCCFSLLFMFFILLVISFYRLVPFLRLFFFFLKLNHSSLSNSTPFYFLCWHLCKMHLIWMQACCKKITEEIFPRKKEFDDLLNLKRKHFKSFGLGECTVEGIDVLFRRIDDKNCWDYKQYRSNRPGVYLRNKQLWVWNS